MRIRNKTVKYVSVALCFFLTSTGTPVGQSEAKDVPVKEEVVQSLERLQHAIQRYEDSKDSSLNRHSNSK